MFTNLVRLPVNGFLLVKIVPLLITWKCVPLVNLLCYGQDEIACHLHPILCTWDLVITCTPVTVFKLYGHSSPTARSAENFAILRSPRKGSRCFSALEKEHVGSLVKWRNSQLVRLLRCNHAAIEVRNKLTCTLGKLIVN